MRHIRYWLLTFTILCNCCFSLAPSSFPQAKKIADKIFIDHKQTLYCQCDYDASHKVDLSSCGMGDANGLKRANRTEWEHMMPAQNFGRQLECWQRPLCEKNGKAYKGRRCCEKIDPIFRQIEAELYNIFPAVGIINQVRSNYRFSMLEGNGRFHGCPFKVDKQLRKVEPSDYAKGIVARANLFVAYRYQIELSKSQRMLFESWDNQYPPTPWEKEWAHRVYLIEGYKNFYIEK